MRGKRRNKRTGGGAAAVGLVSTRAAEEAARWSSDGPRCCLSAFISPPHNSRKPIGGSEWLIEQSGKAIGENPGGLSKAHRQTELFVALHRGPHGIATARIDFKTSSVLVFSAKESRLVF